MLLSTQGEGVGRWRGGRRHKVFRWASNEAGGGGSHTRQERVLLSRCSCRSHAPTPPVCVPIETRVQVQESVRGKDVFVIQTVSK